MIDISVILPVYKTRNFVRELFQRICRVLETEKQSFEVIFVDDACPDRTIEVLEEMAREDDRIAVLSMSHNVGQQRAVMAGLQYSRGKWVVVMDADLQDPPEAIVDLLKIADYGYDAIFAGRRGHYESSGRLFTSRFYKWVLHKVSGVPRDAGLYVLMSRKMVNTLIDFREPVPFVVAMTGLTGLPLASTAVMRNPRPEGTSSYTSFKRLKLGINTVLWVIKRKYFRKVMPVQNVLPEIPLAAVIGARFTASHGGKSR